ncbi:hypothetical protein BGX29_007676 [Mortierella sp. GBA35]|nr:hypothetical protein BGX29_007676 [Mortierella sp. GBA35]
MTNPQVITTPATTEHPMVLIVGAGLAGLMFGLLLHKGGVPVEIFERAKEVKSLGIYEEFVKLGKHVSAIQVCNEQRQVEYKIDFSGQDVTFGAVGYIISRPLLYDLLLRQFPKDRLHLGTKIASIDQDQYGVSIASMEGAIYTGDILVGADGAYSAVRNELYKKMKDEGRLPYEDTLPLPFSTMSVLGQTRPLTESEFPDLAMTECQFRNTLGDNKPYSWSTFTTKQNTVCWGVMRYLDETASKEDEHFEQSEWSHESAETMSEQVRDFSVISGGERPLTVGDLIDWTPKEQISVVMFEEKVFNTWFDGRTALIGDACHKFNPSGGVGAVNAMHDAIVLANYIHALPPKPTAEEITTAFMAYKDERFSFVQEAAGSSRVFKTMTGSDFSAKVIRFITKRLPVWVMRYVQVRANRNRLQVYFLPRADDTGTVRPAPQPSLDARRLFNTKRSAQTV